jgi:SSS family solute:Na+ symporter
VGDYVGSILILVAYFVATLWVGLVAWRRYPATDVEGYVLGGRGLGWVVTAMTLMATQYSALTFSGFPAQFYRVGIGAFIGITGMYIFFAAFYWMIFGGRTWKLGRAFGHMTASDMANDFWSGSSVGIVMGIVLFLALLPYVVTQITGAAQLVDVASGGFIPAAVAGVLIYAITFVYVFLGGMRSVAYVDTLQGFILLLGIVGGSLLLIYGLGGGIGPAFNHMATAYPERAVAGAKPWDWLFMWTWAIPVGFGWVTHPHMWLRMHVPKDIRVIRFWPMWATISFPLAMGGGLFAAVTALKVLPGQEKVADRIIPMMMDSNYPKIVLGLIAAAGLAAMMSSLSSQLHGLGVSAMRDVITKVQKRKLTAMEEARYMRWAIGISASIGLYLFYTMEAYLAQLGAYSAALGAVVVPTAVAALAGWKWATKEGAIASMIGGTLGIWFTGGTFGASAAFRNYIGIYAGSWGLLISIVLLVAVSFVSRSRPSDERIKAFQSVGW